MAGQYLVTTMDGAVTAGHEALADAVTLLPHWLRPVATSVSFHGPQASVGTR